MSLTFAVADLHGRRDLLDAALVAIEHRAAAGTIVFLGDYVDRGPDGAGVLERLMGGAPPGWRWIRLKGNHEAMMSLALRNPERLDWWLDNGGDATISSYAERRDWMARHLPWIEALPAMHTDAHRIYVHAGVERAMPLDAQPDRVLLWKRYAADDAGGHGALHVVHGHEPDVDGPLRLAGRTALDTLAWRTGRLAVGVFDDERAGGPIEIIEVGRRAALSA